MISMTISTITSRMKTKISRMEKETPVPERGTGVFLSGNQFDIEGEENEKGEIYEGVVERIDFPNKGRVHVEGETVTVKMQFRDRRSAFRSTKKKEPHGGPPARSNRKIPDGKARSGLQYFPVLRRMHVPDDEL